LRNVKQTEHFFVAQHGYAFIAERAKRYVKLPTERLLKCCPSMLNQRLDCALIR